MLKLMYITSDPAVAKVAMECSVDRIFIDMETIGKDLRQGGLDTVQSKHTYEDIKNIKAVMIPDRELLVRSNPIYDGTAEEIDNIISCGADIVMLPYFQTADQVRTFVNAVGGRAKCCILIESKEAIDNLDDILSVDGVDEYYVGLNDLHLDYGMKFMFEPLASGFLGEICEKIKRTGKPFGFGGVARVGEGMLPAESIIMEHYHLGSECVILSRTFCNSSIITDLNDLRVIFSREVSHIRIIESILQYNEPECALYRDNHAMVSEVVNRIVDGK